MRQVDPPRESYYHAGFMDLLDEALVATEQEALRVERLIGPDSSGRDIPSFWEPGVGRELYVPVDDAEIRVFHFTPRRPLARRPIVLVPGWGATPEGFQAFYAGVHGKAELFYLETREKASSRIRSPRADMTMSRSAQDIQTVLKVLGLTGSRDFVLMGACWGSTLILQGLLERTVDAPTIILGDPMHTLWFPKWVLRRISPLLPLFAARMLRPILLRTMLGDMKEPAQKKRAVAFVRSADPWRWKKSAEAARDFELFGALSAIAREVFVVNGTRDKVHDQRDYPRIARELPYGRFLFLHTDESLRERMFAAVALEFAKLSAADGLPPALAGFEKRIR